MGVRGYVFYGVTGKRVPTTALCRSRGFEMVLSLNPTDGKRTLVLPGSRTTGVCRLSSRVTTGTVVLTGGVTATVATTLGYSKFGVMRGGNRYTKRAMFRFRVRLVPECGKSRIKVA